MTRVSVVVPVYNHASYLVEALRSVLDQDHDDLEVVCIDDGSRDTSVAQLVRMLGPEERRVVVIPQDNAGAHAAINRGLAMATGDLVMILNSDDRFGERRIPTFVRTWESCGRPRDFWGLSSVAFIGDDGEPMDPSTRGLSQLSEYNHHLSLAAYVPLLLPFHNVTLTTGNLVATRELLHEMGGFAAHRHVHDWDMVLRLLARVQPVVVPLPLYEYRVHGANTFSTIAAEDSLRESNEVRSTYRQSLLTGSVEQPYAVNGRPFVDHLLSRMPLRSAFTG